MSERVVTQTVLKHRADPQCAADALLALAKRRYLERSSSNDVNVAVRDDVTILVFDVAVGACGTDNGLATVITSLSSRRLYAPCVRESVLQHAF